MTLTDVLGELRATTRPRASWPATWRTRSTAAAFVDALRALAEAGKPALVLPAGRSERRRRAPRSSHTGVAGGLGAGDRGRGARRRRHRRAHAGRARRAGQGAARRRPRLRGRRIAVLADGGGHGVLATDLLTDAGFELARAGSRRPPSALAPELPNSQAVEPGRHGRRGGDGRRRRSARLARRAGRRPTRSTPSSSRATSAATRSTPTRRPQREVAVGARHRRPLASRRGKPVLVHSMNVPARRPAIRGAAPRAGVATYRAGRGRDPGPRRVLSHRPRRAVRRAAPATCRPSARRPPTPRRARCSPRRASPSRTAAWPRDDAEVEAHRRARSAARSR